MLLMYCAGVNFDKINLQYVCIYKGDCKYNLTDIRSIIINYYLHNRVYQSVIVPATYVHYDDSDTDTCMYTHFHP